MNTLTTNSEWQHRIICPGNDKKIGIFHTRGKRWDDEAQVRKSRSIRGGQENGIRKAHRREIRLFNGYFDGNNGSITTAQRVCMCVSVCESDTSCGAALPWLTAPVWLYNSWSLLSVWLYKHKIRCSFRQNSSIDHYSEIPQPRPLSSIPFLSCQSIALCADFYPLTNHSAPLLLSGCQSRGISLGVWCSTKEQSATNRRMWFHLKT